MEKRRPTYDLAAVLAVFADPGALAITTSAFRDATALGFDRVGVTRVIQSMDRTMFVKSMTTFADHRVWQDVYRPTTTAGEVYLKLVVLAVPMVSFKEL